MRRLISSLRSIRLRPATWRLILATGAPALAYPLFALDLGTLAGLAFWFWLFCWWLASLIMTLLMNKGAGAVLVATASILIILAVASSGLPVTVDAWRTRATRQQLAAELLQDRTSFREAKWGLTHPEWPHGLILDDLSEQNPHALFSRTSPAYGWQGYLYAPLGDFKDCIGGYFVREKRWLDAHWFWVWCSPT